MRVAITPRAVGMHGHAVRIARGVIAVLIAFDHVCPVLIAASEQSIVSRHVPPAPHPRLPAAPVPGLIGQDCISTLADLQVLRC